jgi:hypothetical protein
MLAFLLGGFTHAQPWRLVKLQQNWFFHQNSCKIEFVPSSMFGYPLNLVERLGDPEIFETEV